MQPVPGWAYIVVGALISGVSWFVRAKNQNAKAMLYFLIIGLIFIVIGVVRLLLTKASSVSKQGDLAALNAQAQINRAIGMRPGERPQGLQQGQVQQSMQGTSMPAGMPLDPGRSIYARRDAMRAQQIRAPAQDPIQSPLPSGPGGNVMASQLFPYKGVQHDPRTGHHPQQAPGHAQSSSQHPHVQHHPAQQRK